MIPAVAIRASKWKTCRVPLGCHASHTGKIVRRLRAAVVLVHETLGSPGAKPVVVERVARQSLTLCFTSEILLGLYGGRIDGAEHIVPS